MPRFAERLQRLEDRRSATRGRVYRLTASLSPAADILGAGLPYDPDRDVIINRVIVQPAQPIGAA